MKGASESFPVTDASLIQAMRIARESSELHIVHAEEVAGILTALGVDMPTLVAAVLFETYAGQSEISLSVLSQQCGAESVGLFAEALRIEQRRIEWLQVTDSDEKERNESAVAMMLLSMMQDARAVFILLAHQLCLIRHVKRSPVDTQRRVAEETRQVFIPLANRLGIGQIKWEMEDLAFRFLHPEDYKKIATALEERRVAREEYMEDVVVQLRAFLEEAGIEAQVYGRPKHIYSIWRKMQAKHLDFSDLYDVRAVRIVVDSISRCYEALSVVHGHWLFVPKEYDDYIAGPKPNGYQSLHTAVIGPQNKTLEVQIRTTQMHDNAELGVAAHWRYKEGGKRDAGAEHAIEAIRSALSSSEHQIDSGEETKRIFVLSPKGRVVELPEGSTPLDFAYRIHTEIGHRCRGAKIDGKIVPLTTALRSGQQVEVITGKESQPSRDWLSPKNGYLKSHHAISKVKAWFKQQFRDEHIAQGRVMLSREVGDGRLTQEVLAALAQHFHMDSVEDFYAAVGRGDLGIQQVQNAIPAPAVSIASSPEPVTTSKAQKREHGGGIQIEGVGNLLTQLARCCKPIPSDPIMGFITRGRGATIHRADCDNLAHLREAYPDRVLPVNWGKDQKKTYEVDVEIVASDRPALLKDIWAVLANEHINVVAVNTLSNRKTGEARMNLVMDISNYDQLQRTLSRLRALRDVVTAQRVS